MIIDGTTLQDWVMVLMAGALSYLAFSHRDLVRQLKKKDEIIRLQDKMINKYYE